MIFSYFVFLTLSFVVLGTAQECLQPENTSPIYVPADTLALITVNPSKGSCECSGGTEFYFASQNSSDTQYLFDNGFNDIINDCPTLCVCDITDNCYESPTVDPYPLIQLYSYCGSDGCHMRAVTFDILVNKNNGTQIGYDAQFENDRFKPLTDSVYVKANRISCSKCPIQTTCPPATIVTSAPTATTTTTAMAPVCQQPANTSPLCVATDSIGKLTYYDDAFPSLNNSVIYNNTCDCPGGKEFYFTNLNTTDTQYLYENSEEWVGESNSKTTCPVMCICDITNNCYESSILTSSLIGLYSLCSTDGCHMRAIIDIDFFNNETCSLIKNEDQLENGIYKPFTDPVFPKINRISCSKCGGTCSITTTIPITTTTITLNPTAAQPCSNQPPNTAAVYIPTASISPNGIIIKQANGSNSRSAGADYYYSPQPSANAEDLFFNEKDNVHSVCENMCVCDMENNCYQYPEGSTNGIWLFSICQTDGCFMKAFNPTFTPLTNVVNGSQIDSNDQYVNPNELKPLTDSAYLKVSKIGCGGCSSIAAVALCPIIPITTTTVVSTTTTTTTILPSTTTTLVPSTTTTAAPCIQPENTSAIYIPTDSITLIQMPKAPLATCPCSNGTEYYYKSAATDDINPDENFDDFTFSTNCDNMCICDDFDKCYQFLNSTNSLIRIYSYCGTDGCHMRLYNLGSKNNLVNIANSSDVINPIDQYTDSTGMSLKPLTDSAFLKTNKLSCSGCPIQNTCQSNSTTPGSSTATTAMPTTTIPSCCKQPENTSAIYIPNDSISPVQTQRLPQAGCPCTDGTEFYFASQNTSNATYIMENKMNNMLIDVLGCKNLCVCDINNDCYHYINETFASITLNSFCDTDGCYMRAIIVAPTPLYNVATNATFFMENQYDIGNKFKPLTNSIYLKINRLSCMECPIQKTCEKTSSSNETSIAPTTTTPAPCLQPPNTSLIYIQSNSLSSFRFFQQPNGSCECSDGTEYYFSSKNTSDTNFYFENNMQDLHTKCPEMCLCDINEKCYHYETTSFMNSINIYSYCGADGCHMRVINLDGSSFINAVNSSDSISPYDQWLADEITYKPITDAAFIKVNKFGCFGCPVQNSCQTSSPPPPTTMPACIQSENTSMVYISGDSINSLYIGNTPKASCDCSDGKQLYFSSQNISDTEYIVKNHLYDMNIICQNMCICDDNNNCFKFEAETFENSVFLASYCEANGCYMKAVVSGFSNIINIVSNQTINSSNQRVNKKYIPLTDPIYIKVTKVSCNGCPISQSSCASSIMP